MPMRTRTNPVHKTKGSKGRWGTIDTGRITLQSNHICTDEVSGGDCGAFSVSHYSTEDSGGRLNWGTPGSWDLWFQNWKLDCFDDVDGYIPPWRDIILGDKGDGAYATEVAARTNPSRPYVDLAVNLLELGDIAQLIHKTGQSFIERMAANHIRNEFGLRPVIEDSIKLVNFTDQVHRRIGEIHRLKERGRGLRKTVDVATFERSRQYDQVLQSVDLFVIGTITCKQKVIIKGHARWIPSIDLLEMTDAAALALAKKAVLGQTLDLATLWEAMPWSWLIDWCTKMGDYLKANRNIIPCYLDKITISRRYHQVDTWPGWWDTGAITPITVTRDWGYRNQWPVTPTAHLPFLSASQMGILGSLAVLRAK